MSFESAKSKWEKIEADQQVQNLIAQGNARYILFNTNEEKEGFPPYTINDGGLNHLGLQHLQIGCEFAEADDLEAAKEPLEKGAAILEYVHGSRNNRTQLSDLYMVLSALAYYVSFQYSKAFILINKTSEKNTVVSEMIRLFLQRNFPALQSVIKAMMVEERYTDDALAASNLEKGADRIYEITIAKSLNGYIRYFQTGNKEILEQAKKNLHILKEIAELRREPGMWWVVRLLLLISNGFDVASLWNVLGNHLDIGDDSVKKYIHSLVFMEPRGIYELFITQRKALPKVINENESGCVVTIPTSSGKTRIAEIAILQSLINHPFHKVLYIAPFRSLAYEVENTLERVFSKLDVQISHLYGGSVHSRMDDSLLAESNILIATPEKAKAIIRGNREFAEEIKFVIVDEGHLLGADKRLIGNEIFYEELRVLMYQNNGKFLLLSAVLPNASDLALWLTADRENVFNDTWRPSDERLGILDWNGSRVNLNWRSTDTERSSFNNNFIVQEKLPRKPRERTDKYFPADRNEAIATTAYRLRNFGPVLIFVGMKRSVYKMAQVYLKAMADDEAEFVWTSLSNWKAFELACIESYGEENPVLQFARMGILCHNSALTPEVRFPLERLMRDDKPRVIISTSTLGQGVNLGVSTVIFATLHQGGKDISKRDFWNIAGRAGRAFVDHEAKILVAWDQSDRSNQRAIDRNRLQYQKILAYFDKGKIDRAESGILFLLQALKNVTKAAGVDFDLLLTLIAENRMDEIGDNAEAIDSALDWLDDTLLALHELHQTDDAMDFNWIDDFFVHALACIQISDDSDTSQEELVSFFKARIKGVVKKIEGAGADWTAIVGSGIPLNSNLFLERKMPEVTSILSAYDSSNLSTEDLIEITSSIISEIREIPIVAEDEALLQSPDFKELLKLWLSGTPYSEIEKIADAEKTVSGLFSFSLPWILNAISKKFRAAALDEEAGIVEHIAILVESGLPSLPATKVYQAGIRSRQYASELAAEIEDKIFDYPIGRCRRYIIRNKEKLKLVVSERCGEWMDLLSDFSVTREREISAPAVFTFNGRNTEQKVLYPTLINGRQKLVNPDYSFVHDDSNGTLDFSDVNDIPGVYFEYSENEEVWKLKNDNPYLKIKE